MKDKLYIPNKKIIQQQIDVLEDQKYKLDLVSKIDSILIRGFRAVHSRFCKIVLLSVF